MRNFDSQGVGEHETRVNGYAADLGIPSWMNDRLWATARVIDGEDEFDLLWVDDAEDARPLRESDYAAIAAAGAGLRLWSNGENDVHKVRPYLEAGGQGLWLPQPAGFYRGLTAIVDAPTLEVLKVGGKATETIDLAQMSALRVLEASGWSWRSGLAAPKLESLIFTASSGRSLPTVSARLRNLVLDLGRSLVSLDGFGNFSELNRLAVHGAGRLNIAALESAKKLERLDFDNCLGVINADALLSLSLLSEVCFLSVKEVTPLLPLLGLSANRVVVHPNYAFDAEFIAQAHPQPGKWSIDRFRSAGSQAETGLISEESFERLPEWDGQWGIRFEDWATVEQRWNLQSEEIDSLLVQLVFEELLDESLREQVEFDSEGEFVAAYARSPETVDNVIRVWVERWNDPAQLRSARTRAQKRY